MIPENQDECRVRSIKLVEFGYNKVINSSRKGKESVCYLIITHGSYMLEIDNILWWLNGPDEVPHNSFFNLTSQETKAYTEVLT